MINNQEWLFQIIDNGQNRGRKLVEKTPDDNWSCNLRLGVLKGVILGILIFIITIIIFIIIKLLPLLNGEGNGNPLQFSCLENPMDRGA